MTLVLPETRRCAYCGRTAFAYTCPAHADVELLDPVLNPDVALLSTTEGEDECPH